MNTFHKSGEIISHTPASAVSANDVVELGNGQIGIAVNDIAANVAGPVRISGAVSATKATGAWSQGDLIYYDSANTNFTTVPTGNRPAGTAFADATSGATSGYLLLNGSIPGNGTEAVIADPGDAGAVPVLSSGHCSLVSAGAETRTLAAPSFPGQQLTLAMQTDAGDITLTCATAVNQAANNTIVFNDAGDTVKLEAVEVGANNRWRVLVNDGATLSTV